MDARTLLVNLYRAAVDAVAPAPALAAALEDECKPPSVRPVWVVAIGKAAPAMARAALAHLGKYGREPAGGIIVAAEWTSPPHAALGTVVGDHPLPGPRSLGAADQLEDLIARVQPGDEVWVLLSGGATSLAAAPAGPFTQYELATLFTVLLGSGLHIGDMNVVRKRFSRWGGGRLAVSVAHARVRTYLISDVVGDDVSVIGSGPCVPDVATAGSVRRLMAHAGLWERTPSSLRDHLAAVERDTSMETPKPENPAFAGIGVRVIASNRRALEGAAARAQAHGVAACIMERQLAGEAALAGQLVARMLLDPEDAPGAAPDGGSGPVAFLWGGETVVRLERLAADAKGGRCQELALAAARELADGSPLGSSLLLAAGTDGRDGPTDAAGAVVDGRTWEAVQRAGRDPQEDLTCHNAYRALDAAGTLLRTGLTGTNVMDVVIGLRLPPGADAARGAGGITSSSVR